MIDLKNTEEIWGEPINYENHNHTDLPLFSYNQWVNFVIIIINFNNINDNITQCY